MIADPNNCNTNSLFVAIRRWWTLRKVANDLRTGKAKRALGRLQGQTDSIPCTLAEIEALQACGKHGNARKTMSNAVRGWEQQLQSVVIANEKLLFAEAMRDNKPVPLHLLSDMPRHVPGKFLLGDVEIHFPDGPSAASAHHEIYQKRLYDFNCDHAPRIIDGGANIGLATIALKARHPSARVTCFEADAGVAGYLRRNLAAAELSDVEVIEAALWESDEVIEFNSEGSDAGRIGEADSDAKTQRVQGVRLSTYLDERVDFLKLDIEGAELAVLRECAGKLHNVERLFVEYHSFVGQAQGLPELLGILKAAGFRIAATMSDVLSPRPLLEIGSSLGMDMRMNLFGIRTHE